MSEFGWDLFNSRLSQALSIYATLNWCHHQPERIINRVIVVVFAMCFSPTYTTVYVSIYLPKALCNTPQRV